MIYSVFFEWGGIFSLLKLSLSFLVWVQPIRNKKNNSFFIWSLVFQLTNKIRKLKKLLQLPLIFLTKKYNLKMILHLWSLPLFIIFLIVSIKKLLSDQTL